jgi:hypothetical protein
VPELVQQRPQVLPGLVQPLPVQHHSASKTARAATRLEVAHKQIFAEIDATYPRSGCTEGKLIGLHIGCSTSMLHAPAAGSLNSMCLYMSAKCLLT